MGYNQYSLKGNKYYEKDGYIVGIANNSQKEFYIDKEDYELVKQFTWNTKTDSDYLQANYQRKKFSLHRLIMKVNNPKQQIDHINHNVLDNRKCNLRIVTNSQNQMNRNKPKQNTSGVRGVYWHKNKKQWQANIQVDNKLLYLGIFDKKEDAIDARLKAEKQYFKQYNYMVD